MKKLLYLFLLFIIISCSNSKKVYWCGDHPCINVKEKEAYFKKTMIVEIREFNKAIYKSKFALWVRHSSALGCTNSNSNYLRSFGCPGLEPR